MKSTLQIVETIFSPLPSGYQMRKDGVFREMEFCGGDLCLRITGNRNRQAVNTHFG